MASEVMKLIFAVLDASFNSGHYTVIIHVKQQFSTLINEMKPWRLRGPVILAVFDISTSGQETE